MDFKRNFTLLVLYIFMTCFSGGAAQNNMMVGLWYKNFTNLQGALADGTCCDNPSLMEPNCPPNQCDTDFLPCATLVGGTQCTGYFQTPTQPMVDVDSFVLKSRIGNQIGKATPTLNVYISPFSPADIHFNLLAREITGKTKSPMANFTFVIDWMDTFYSNDLHWRQLILKDAYCEFGVDVLHQCARHYFGPTCSVYCKPTHQYTCLNDGSKNCTAGWQGPNCDQLVPYCTSGLCQHGGSCTNIHLGYICWCLPDFWGTHCENTLGSSTTSKLPTILTSQVPTSFNISGTTVLIPTAKNVPVSKSGNETTIVATSVSAGLILFGLLAAAVYVAYRMKQQKNIEKVHPAQSPPVSHTETLVSNQ